MKAKRVEIEQIEGFKPFAIQIVVESKEEAQALYAIFNITKNADMLNNSSLVKEAIGKEYYVSNYKEVISKGITYEQYYCGDAWNAVK